jgi:hypothetical protein
MLKCERLKEGLGRDCGPAAKQMVQLAGAHSRRCGNGVDLGLGAPALADKSDGAAHDGIVGGGADKRLAIANRVGGEHVGPWLDRAPLLRWGGGCAHPVSACNAG